MKNIENQEKPFTKKERINIENLIDKFWGENIKKAKEEIFS